MWEQQEAKMVQAMKAGNVWQLANIAHEKLRLLMIMCEELERRVVALETQIKLKEPQS